MKPTPGAIIKGQFDILVNIGRIIKQNGPNPIKILSTLFRTDDLKWGNLVGVDKYGNRYYENNFYIWGQNRWVIYADHVGMNYDGSQVSPEWHGWLHYRTDLLPFNDPSRPNYKWMIDHKENMSGTKEAYMPYSTTKPKIEAWKPS
ncbi:probable NADH dehydrogenase [ubiquinone] 1 alpha subcomplex subunit 12 [Chelonus insularis]|uniref:probable NADH dehydrogenase [ubiquinone] 1 alpha subcomplex subunit 12 n=1 Tax=Chelonus insularis TaxID=460826 RepID=UPI00158D9DC9|nr:probable NADH dehydrogenase [ubiquinone] 1 alpha subcomplex subunit 12 [Chelonus insularis]